MELVLLAVKSGGLPRALDDVAGSVGPSTRILPLLNGVEHLGVIEGRYGGQVLGGVCIVATQLEGDGTIRRLGPGASISYGELDGAITPSCRGVRPGRARIERCHG